MAKAKKVNEEQVSNGGKEAIETGMPYIVKVKIQGSSDMLFHKWDCSDVEAKSAAAKGSKAKKTDNIESFVYRNEDGELCLPGEYLRMSCINAAKFKQDPRSPRKSAMDLYKAGIISLTPLASLGVDKWDFEDKRRVVIQRSAISRIRPAMRSGWEASFEFMINLPEYISTIDFNETLQMAGRLIGVGDFRPTFGRFNVIEFNVAC